MALKREVSEPVNRDLASDFEYKVKFKSRTAIDFQFNKYKALLNNLLDGQNQIPENTRTALLEEFTMTLVSAVEMNISIDGHSSEDVFFENGDAVTMDDLLDDKIVDTTSKRRCYPTRIVPFVLKSLKAERKQMEMYEHVIDQERMEPDAPQDNLMKDVLSQAPTRHQQAVDVMKSFREVCVRAEGLQEVLRQPPLTQDFGGIQD